MVEGTSASSETGRYARVGEGLARADFEAVLELLPIPILLVEPGTAEIAYANAAADRMAGGVFPRSATADEYDRLYYCTGADGRRIARDAMPGVRVARGESFHGSEMDWHLPDGIHSLLVSADTVADADGRPVCVLAFEDVTAVKRAQRSEDASVAVLDTVFASAPVGLAFFDGDLRCVRVNAALTELDGRPEGEHLGATLRDVLPALEDGTVAALRGVVDSGVPLLDVEVTGETAGRPGILRHWLYGFYPVRQRTGEALGLGAIVSEITDRVELLEAERRARERAERAERRSAFLARAGEVLGGSLNYDETLRRVARLAVPDKADWCVVDILGAGGRIERLAVAHADPGQEEQGWALSRRWPVRLDDPGGVAEVIRTGRSLVYGEIPDALLEGATRDAEHLAATRAFGLSSAIIVPLRVRQRTVGALTFALTGGERAYGDEDLLLALEVARRASSAIENARLYRERSHIAQTLQRSLLPPRLPEIPGFEVAACYRAAGEGHEVGGDFYDVFETAAGGWSMVVGDVCGKGPHAASLTSLARYTIRAAALVAGAPSEALEVANEAILRERDAEHFLTVVLGSVSVANGVARLVLASAGHPPALILRAGGAVEAIKGHGALLGVSTPGGYDDIAVMLEAGDAVVAYTDGVLDAGAPERFLEPAELSALLGRMAGAPAADLAAAVERAALEASGGDPRDDIAALVLRHG